MEAVFLGMILVVWGGSIILMEGSVRRIVLLSHDIRSTESLQSDLLSLQEPIVVYAETGSYAQKVRFNVLSQELLLDLHRWAGGSRKVLPTATAITGIIVQVRMMGRTFFDTGTLPKERRQAGLAISNLLFESVRENIRPSLLKYRSEQKELQQRTRYVQLADFVVFIAFVVISLTFLRWVRSQAEKEILDPIGKLSEWAQKVVQAEGEQVPAFSHSSGYDAEILSLESSIVRMGQSLTSTIGRTRTSLKHSELISMIIQASGFMSREEDILRVASHALTNVFSPEEIVVELTLNDPVSKRSSYPFDGKTAPNALSSRGLSECWAIRKGGLVSDQDWNGLVRCDHCEAGRVQGSYLCSPIIANDETIGIITLRNPKNDRVWSEEDKAFLRDVASHVGMSISKIRLLDLHWRQAIRDPLTGLYNRRFLDEQFRRVMSAIKRNRAPYSIIMMDLDHFKEVNDNLGHDRGDEVLQKTALLIEKSIRGGADVVVRTGGEEFALLVQSDVPGARRIAEKIRSQIGLAFQEDAFPMPVTVSLGVARIRADDSLESALKRADELLYEAKRSGRNRAVCEQFAEGESGIRD